MKIYSSLLRFSATVAVALSFGLAGQATAKEKPKPSPPALETAGPEPRGIEIVGRQWPTLNFFVLTGY